MAKHPVYITFYHTDRLDIDNHAAVGKMVVDAIKGAIAETQALCRGPASLDGRVEVEEDEQA